jgi:hypothetical protein
MILPLTLWHCSVPVSGYYGNILVSNDEQGTGIFIGISGGFELIEGKECGISQLGRDL